MKYFLFGGMSAAFTLFGMSLIYGLSGSTNLHQIATALAGRGLDPLLVVAIVMTVIGFGFKVAAVPFHLWAPDAYEGAPTPSAAFIASGSKVASFFIFAKVMMIGFAGAEGGGAYHNFLSGWTPVLDLYQDNDNVVAMIELPGMRKEDIDISLRDGVLTIAGERQSSLGEGDNAERTERFSGKFRRSITLPTRVDAGKVSASYKDGILTVTLPKAEEAKPKKVEVTIE